MAQAMVLGCSGRAAAISAGGRAAAVSAGGAAWPHRVSGRGRVWGGNSSYARIRPVARLLQGYL